MVKATPNYIISGTHASSLVLLHCNSPIIGFISYNWGNQNCDSKQWNMLI